MSVTSGGTAPNGCSAGGRSAASAGSAGIVITLSTAHRSPSRCQRQTEADRSAVRHDDADEAVASPRGRARGAAPAPSGARRRGRPPAGARPSARSQKCRRWPYFPPSSSSGTRPFSIIDGRAPLAGDQRVLGEVPPGVVGEVLRAAVGLPGPQHVERVVVEQRDAARSVVAVRAAQAGQEDRRPGRSAGCAAGSSRPCSASSVRLDRLGSVGLRRVGLGVVDVHVRAAQARQQQVAALQPVLAHVVPLVHERAASRRSSRSGAARRRGSAGRPSRRRCPYVVGGRVDVDHGERVRASRRPGRRRRRRPGARSARRRLGRGCGRRSGRRSLSRGHPVTARVDRPGCGRGSAARGCRGGRGPSGEFGGGIGDERAPPGVPRRRDAQPGGGRGDRAQLAAAGRPARVGACRAPGRRWSSSSARAPARSAPPSSAGCPDGRRLAVELDPELAAYLRATRPELEVIEGDAAHLRERLAELDVTRVDAVISGLPWALFDQAAQESILGQVAGVIGSDGAFTTFAYLHGMPLAAARRFRRTLRATFDEVVVSATVWRNLPPAFAYVCRRPVR